MRGKKESTHLNEISAIRSLRSGDHEGVLEDYFGADQYAELIELAKEDDTRAKKGPRVLILPGIMGSNLSWEGDRIWVDLLDIAQGRLADLRYSEDPSDEESPMIKPSGVILFAYLLLKLHLRSKGFNADFYAYDWRKSLSDLGREFAGHLSGEKDDEIHVVAHSMGGLVTRSAMAAGTDKIGRFIMLGTPNYGSFVPVQAFRGVYPIVRKVAFIDQEHTAEELADTIFNTFPGLYEMLPFPEKFSSFNLYDLETWPDGAPKPLKSRLDNTRKVQDSLSPPGERSYLIAGVNQDTVVDLGIEGGKFTYEISKEGDGTVPLSFALIPGAKTYYVEESHGSLPNNRKVRKAVVDLLGSGETRVLNDHWTPSRSGFTRTICDSDVVEYPYRGEPGRSLSTREARLLLEEVASPGYSREGAGAAMEGGASPGVDIEADIRTEALVIGRRRRQRLEIRIVKGSISDVDARAYALGMFRDVRPGGAARIVDELMAGTLGEIISRRMFPGNIGEVSIVPTGRHPVRSDLIMLAGLGPFDKFRVESLEIVGENVIRTFIRTKVEDFATVLFGGDSGVNSMAAMRSLLKGFINGLVDADRDRQFRRVTICETDDTRFSLLKGELIRLSGTPIFKDVELLLEEAVPEPSMVRVRLPDKPQPLYLIIRQEEAVNDNYNFSASVLTAGSKATVVTKVKEVNRGLLEDHLALLTGDHFGFSKVGPFGEKLAAMVLPEEILELLSRFPEHHFSIVHDKFSARIPWETIGFKGWFPSVRGGISRRYLAQNMSIAKWLEKRKYENTMEILLVVNPTEDLGGAEDEGERILELIGQFPAIRPHVLRGPQATRDALLTAFSSGRFDVIHYAGHAYFDPQRPARSGILCHGRQVLSGSDLAGVGNLPGLMFFNACESGRIRKGSPENEPPPGKKDDIDAATRIRNSVGLAEAFLRGGLANYVGTYWPVGDRSAKKFAEVFYGRLMAGKSIGQALLEGRRAIHAGKSMDWADYILYGDPDFVIKTVE